MGASKNKRKKERLEGGMIKKKKNLLKTRCCGSVAKCVNKDKNIKSELSTRCVLTEV